MPQGTELKILSDSGSTFKVGGYGVVFGGQDVTGDQFTADTDFWLDRITQNPPVLYQHGGDSMLKRTAVGRVTSTNADDVGLWVEAQITAAKKYADAIRQLIAKGVLGWSSGSVPHLVQRVKSTSVGVMEITSWPIVELSLTPTPAEPRTIGVKELKALAANEPLLRPIVRDAERTAKEAKVAMVDLPDSAFAFVESDGALDDEKKTVPRAKRHYPHHAEDGDLDADLVSAGLSQALKDGRDPVVIAHLLRHAAGHVTHESGWTSGNGPRLLALSHRLALLAEDAVEGRKSMEHIRLDTKDGDRFTASALEEGIAIYEALGQVIEWAKSIERGEDGKQRVDLFRHRLAMLELEEVS